MADSEKYFTKTVDGQLSVATVAQSGEIIPEESRPGDKYTTALVQTDDGPQLCVKTFDLNGGGGGGGDVPSNVYTQDNLIAGTNISITEVPQPIIDSNTLGVWHFDGNTDNAISNSALSWNTSYGGNVVYESGFKKFGSSCARLSTRNTNTTPVFTGDTQTFMTGDWTWDFWIFVNSGATPGSNTIVWSVGYTGTNTYSICVSATDVRLQQNGQSVVSDIATSTWHHIAFVKEGVNLYRFFNGKLIDTTEVNPSDIRRIYRYCGTDTAKNNTFFDEMRFSDVARWTEDFTPFSHPYSEGGDPIYQINNTQSAPDLSSKYVPIITTDQFTMGPDGQTPLPVIDDIKEGGTYLVKLDLSTLAPGTIFSYTLTVLAMPGQGITQQLQWSNSLIMYERRYENNTWSSWSETTLTNLATVLQRYNGADSTKTQVLKNVNGTLTWVDEA